MILGNANIPSQTGVMTGTGVPVEVKAYTSPSTEITASAALSDGTLIIEESSDPLYAGTWSQIESVTLSSVFSGAGGKSVRHHPQSSYGYIRTRVGTTVAGGTISTIVQAS